ncbi:MAG TPA: ABC transporter substrate-binding protein [Micromonosporaceae bacterium]
MRLNRAVAAALLATSLTLITGCQTAGDTTGDTRDLVIAADLELNGADAAIGQVYERALRLKVDEINASGVLGSRKVKLQVRDNRSDRTLSTGNITDFTNDPSVSAIITGACAECIVYSAKRIDDRHVPTISLSPADVVTPVEDRRYIFKVAPNAADSAAALASEIQHDDVTKIGLLTTDDAYGKTGREVMTQEIDKLKGTANSSARSWRKPSGPEIATSTTIRPTDTDVSQAVDLLLAKNIDAMVVWAFPNQAVAIAEAARSAGYKGKLYFDAAAAGNLFLSGPAAEATEGTKLVFSQTLAIDDVVASTPAKAARKQWFEDYTSRYGAYNGYASFAADAVQLLVNGVVVTGGVDRERLKDVLETSQFDGLSGQIRITPDNHSGLMPQALTSLIARNGRWRLGG